MKNYSILPELKRCVLKIEWHRVSQITLSGTTQIFSSMHLFCSSIHICIHWFREISIKRFNMRIRISTLAITVTKRKTTGYVHPLSYLNRKWHFVVLARAICDYRYRFTFSHQMCWSNSWICLFDLTSFVQRFDEGDLSDWHFIAVDEAYACSYTIIATYLSCEAAERSSEYGYNFYQSSH